MATTLVLAGTLFLPWTRSGRVSRSGWDVAGSARRLGIVDSGIGEAAVLVFFAVPMFVFLALVFHSVGRYPAAATLAATTILVTVVVAAAIVRSSLGIRWGLWLNTVIAAVDSLLVIRLVVVMRLAGQVRSES